MKLKQKETEGVNKAEPPQKPPRPPPPTQTQKRYIHRPPGNLRLLPRHRAEGESGERKMKEVGGGKEKKIEREREEKEVDLSCQKNTSVPQSAHPADSRALTLVVFL